MYAERCRCLNRSRESVFFRQHIIATGTEHAKRHFESDRTAGGQRARPVRIWWIVDDLCVLGDEAEELSRTRCLAVVERYRQIIQRLSFPDVVLASGQDLAGRSSLSLGKLRRPGNFDTDLLERKIVTTWQAASKTDNARLLEMLSSALEGGSLTRAALEIYSVVPSLGFRLLEA